MLSIKENIIKYMGYYECTCTCEGVDEAVSGQSVDTNSSFGRFRSATDEEHKRILIRV